MAVTTNTPQMKMEYQILFDTCLIRPEKYAEVDAVVNRIVAARPKYEAVAGHTGVPWYFIGIVHNMECSGNFNGHLHNGDPLTARTKNVPKGYPKTGMPPFTWEDSALDALKLRSLHKLTSWTVPDMLYQLEGYNGFGYRPRGINSPYLWSYSNHYAKGKYTADGIFDPKAVSKQVGAAVILRRMSERQLAVAGDLDPLTRIRRLAESVPYAPSTYNAKAEELQNLLNSVGQTLKPDGIAGRMTSDAVYRVTGKYLKGDPMK